MEVALDAAPKLSTLGKYSLIASLGQGGMAKVYLALMAGPAGFNKLLVVKALREDMLSQSEEFVHMFLDEARLAARLNHPNIVQTYEVGESDGRYFIAMEYLEGQALRTVQRRMTTGMPLDEELRVVSETARGLHYAHDLKGFNGEPLGVVHRDVSPQNVFLTYDGQVKLLDFGIAKTQDAEHLTKVGVIKGKIDYIAPEQIRGERIDRRADIFALGAMLWEAATGRRFAGGPKVADVTKIHTRVTGGEPKAKDLSPELPDELVAIIDKSIALDPDNRYPTAAALADDLEHYLEKLAKKPSSKTLTELMTPLFEGERSKMRQLVDQQIQLAQKRGGVVLGETTGGLPRLGRTTMTGTPSNIDLTESGYLDLGGELPALETSAPSSYSKAGVQAAQEAPQQAAPRKGVPKSVVLGIVAAFIVVAMFLALKSEPETAVQAALPARSSSGAIAPANTEPNAQPPEQPVVVTPTPETVRIHVDVWPATAVVTLDGSQLPKLPFTADLLKDGTMHHIQASAPGHETRKIMLPFDSDREVKIVLEEKTAHPVRRRPGGANTPSAPSASATPSPAPAASPEPRKSQEDVAPGADLVPSKPRVRTGIDLNDPYSN